MLICKRLAPPEGPMVQFSGHFPMSLKLKTYETSNPKAQSSVLEKITRPAY